MSVTTYPSAHDLTNCHDVRHNGPGCPSCDGVKITCRTHKAPSGSHPALASGPEERTQGGGSSRTSPHGSPRPRVVPSSIDVYLPATGTASRSGEAFPVLKVKWSAWISHVDGRVVVSVTAFGADRMQNVTWYASEGEPPAWATPAPEWFHEAVQQMRDEHDEVAASSAEAPSSANPTLVDVVELLEQILDRLPKQGLGFRKVKDQMAAQVDQAFERDGGLCRLCGCMVNRSNRRSKNGLAILHFPKDVANSHYLICLGCQTNIREQERSEEWIAERLSGSVDGVLPRDGASEERDSGGLLGEDGEGLIEGDPGVGVDVSLGDTVEPADATDQDESGPGVGGVTSLEGPDLEAKLGGLDRVEGDGEVAGDQVPKSTHDESVPEPSGDTPDLPPDDSGEWTRVDHGAAWLGEGEQIPTDSTTWLNRRTGERRPA